MRDSLDREDADLGVIRGDIELEAVLGTRVSGVGTLHLARPKPQRALTHAAQAAAERRWRASAHVVLLSINRIKSEVVSHKVSGIIHGTAQPVEQAVTSESQSVVESLSQKQESCGTAPCAPAVKFAQASDLPPAACHVGVPVAEHSVVPRRERAGTTALGEAKDVPVS